MCADQTDKPKPALTLPPILFTVASAMNVETGEMLGRGRHHRVTGARRVFSYLARRLTPCSFPEIGAYCGRDHSSIVEQVYSFGQKRDEQFMIGGEVVTLGQVAMEVEAELLKKYRVVVG